MAGPHELFDQTGGDNELCQQRPGSNCKAGSDRAIAVRPLFQHADTRRIPRHFEPIFIASCGRLWP
jgi:hypothetical protein